MREIKTTTLGLKYFEVDSDNQFGSKDSVWFALPGQDQMVRSLRERGVIIDEHDPDLPLPNFAHAARTGEEVTLFDGRYVLRFPMHQAMVRRTIESGDHFFAGVVSKPTQPDDKGNKYMAWHLIRSSSDDGVVLGRASEMELEQAKGTALAAWTEPLPSAGPWNVSGVPFPTTAWIYERRMAMGPKR